MQGPFQISCGSRAVCCIQWAEAATYSGHENALKEQTVRDRETGSEPAILAGLMAAIIVYGSLFPFHFQKNPGTGGPLSALLSTWRTGDSRGDVLANILLYIPLGFFAVRSLRRLRPAWRIFAATAAGFALSTAMELAQTYEPGRDAAMADIYSNTAGTLFGAIAGIALAGTAGIPILRILSRRPFAVSLIACYLGYRLFPYAPVIDVHKYWHAVKPLFSSPAPPAPDLFRHTMLWLALAALLEAILGIRRSRWAFPLFAGGLLFLRILVLDAELSSAEVLGAVFAALAWAALFSRVPGREIALAALFAASVAVDALAPFDFSAAHRRFEWIPFRGFMISSAEMAIRSFFQKAFVYGALLWLMVRAGLGLGAAAVGAAFVFALRLAQVYLPFRSAEITDAAMLLVIAGIVKLMREDRQFGNKSDSFTHE
jgi:VanZ family protein